MPPADKHGKAFAFSHADERCPEGLFRLACETPWVAGDSVQGSPINACYVVPTDAGSAERSAELCPRRRSWPA